MLARFITEKGQFLILICKGTARDGGRRRVQADSARMVSGQGDVSGGVAGADERADGGGALRQERAETAEALAELIIAEELKRGRWQEADLN